MHPILFRLGPLDIHTYGVLVAAGFLSGLMLAGRRAKAQGLDPRAVSDLGIWLIVAGMGGAKLFHLVFFWDDFLAGWRHEGVRSLREGFVFFGGFIGAVVATIVFARKRQQPLWKLADLFAPCLALGHAFGRLGCFFNGCCYGAASTMPWTVKFSGNHAMHSQSVHPTQLYEAVGNLVLFGLLSAFSRRKRFDGQVWWWYVLAYGAMRFAIEFLRGDYTVHYFGVFTIAHFIAVALMMIAAIGLWGTTRWRGATP
ncbi:MAG: prolipoprotein diacylglyceryl transferase [Verrucomicrobia bacterium]|nr:prolipoprotein diacylglyceryl transferase [Verrucomicrobiota bacterium]